MSFPAYERYKESGVEWLGKVPSHWEVRRLKQVANAFPSNVDKKSYEDEEPVRLCNYTDVYYNDTIGGDLEFMEATASADQVEKFSLRANDVIITKDSETADDIAIAAHVPHDLQGVVCGYHLTMVRPGPASSGAFLKRFFDSAFAKASFAVRANGLTRVGLAQYAVDNVDVPYPPLAEQRAVADFLDRETAKIDALVEAQRRLIELLKEKRQAVISHAVTKGLDASAPMKDSGVEWLGQVPAHWEIVPIKRVTKTIEQGWSPQCESYPVQSREEWGVLKVGCVNGGWFSPEENKTLPVELEPVPELGICSGDLLVSRANTRELVGSAAVAEAAYPNLLLCDKLYRLRLDVERCRPTLLALFLGTREARAQIELAATGASSSMLNIGQAVILELPLPLPPPNEQAEVLSWLESQLGNIDNLTAEARAAITLLQERRAALISAAVTGKIDVRGLAQTAEAA